MAKTFSLSAFVKDLIADMDGAELSWDIKVQAYSDYFAIIFPIKFYSKRTIYLGDKVRRVAEKHGLRVATHHCQTDHDVWLEGTFTDITGEK